ncbi:HD domain-containing protein [Candidatus Parcubacteria bacterium]|nr:MAG: HD domain-containing protein [Candidatus Parcubacteria bacterium]
MSKSYSAPDTGTPIFSSLALKAREFAVKAHGSQMYGDLPYSAHLDAVASLARPYGLTCEAIAYLHDVAEDTDTDHYDIWCEFGDPIAACVYLVTDPVTTPGANRKVRKALANAKLNDVRIVGRYPEVLIVKACDRLANMLSCSQPERFGGNPGLFKMYAREYEAFRAACWTPGLCDSIWAELDQLALGTKK